MKPQTLLEKARSVPMGKCTISDEELDLALAVINGDITARQAAIALGRRGRVSSMFIAYRCFATIRDAVAVGKVARIERIHTKNGK